MSRTSNSKRERETETFSLGHQDALFPPYLEGSGDERVSGVRKLSVSSDFFLLDFFHSFPSAISCACVCEEKLVGEFQ